MGGQGEGREAKNLKFSRDLGGYSLRPTKEYSRRLFLKATRNYDLKCVLVAQRSFLPLFLSSYPMSRNLLLPGTSVSVEERVLPAPSSWSTVFQDNFDSSGELKELEYCSTSRLEFQHYQIHRWQRLIWKSGQQKFVNHHCEEEWQ